MINQSINRSYVFTYFIFIFQNLLEMIGMPKPVQRKARKFGQKLTAAPSRDHADPVAHRVRALLTETDRRDRGGVHNGTAQFQHGNVISQSRGGIVAPVGMEIDLGDIVIGLVGLGDQGGVVSDADKVPLPKRTMKKDSTQLSNSAMNIFLNFFLDFFVNFFATFHFFLVMPIYLGPTYACSKQWAAVRIWRWSMMLPPHMNPAFTPSTL